MKNLKKFAFLSLTALAITGCNGGETVKYERHEEDEVYASILGDYDAKFSTAIQETDNNKRYVKYAEAEAKLLASAVMLPTITQGGAYAMTRVAPRTVPYITFGLDSDRLRQSVVVTAGADSSNKLFITSEDRAALLEEWQAAYDAQDSSLYNPKAYLEGQGYTFATSFVSTFSDDPVTLDPNSTYYASDTETLCNSIEGLVEWDNVGELQPRIASSIAYDADTKTYTFTINPNAKWFNSTGAEVRRVKAGDFVKGFQHSLDASTETGFYELMGTIKGAVKYFEESKDTAWFNENVGISAPDDDTLVIELAKEEPYFLSRLTYSPFMPINPEKFVEEGGAFGVAAYAEAVAKEDYNYGNVKQLSSTYYNSAFYPTKITGGTGGEIIYTRNTNYYWNDQTNLNTLKWIYDKGDKPQITYASVVAGDITATGLSEAAGTLAKAKTDGYFAKYNYISDTNATTYLCGFNTNRGTFEVGETIATSQSEAQKIATNKAMNNLNFRRALQHAWDREVYNAKSKGTEVAKLSIRNLYTQPNFVRLSDDVNYANHVFEAGLFYYEIVEYFLKNELGYHVDLSDSQDGWYNPLLARGYLQSAILEMGEDWKKVELDIVYLSASATNTAQAQAFKESVENALGADNVTVNIIGTDSTAEFYAAGYRAGTGVKGCFDVFYGSGWGPDFQDPSSYLATFAASGSGEMIKLTGNY